MSTFTLAPTPAEERFWQIYKGVWTDGCAAIQSNHTHQILLALTVPLKQPESGIF
jgi:hypothetical protein